MAEKLHMWMPPTALSMELSLGTGDMCVMTRNDTVASLSRRRVPFYSTVAFPSYPGPRLASEYEGKSKPSQEVV